MRNMVSQLSKYLGEHLRVLHIKKDLTQQQVAERIGSERGYIAKIEQGYTLPSLKLSIQEKIVFQFSLGGAATLI
jgi:DNA-binding XRE family transcriptional regulator